MCGGDAPPPPRPLLTRATTVTASPVGTASQLGGRLTSTRCAYGAWARNSPSAMPSPPVSSSASQAPRNGPLLTVAGAAVLAPDMVKCERHRHGIAAVVDRLGDTIGQLKPVRKAGTRNRFFGSLKWHRYARSRAAVSTHYASSSLKDPCRLALTA